LVNRNAGPLPVPELGGTFGIVMEHLPVEIRDAGLHISGFPNAVKVVAIKSTDANTFAHLSLHRADLGFALDMLDLLSKQEGECTRIQHGFVSLNDKVSTARSYHLCRRNRADDCSSQA
jgi:hypothetical protein